MSDEQKPSNENVETSGSSPSKMDNDRAAKVAAAKAKAKALAAKKAKEIAETNGEAEVAPKDASDDDRQAAIAKAKAKAKALAANKTKAKASGSGDEAESNDTSDAADAKAKAIAKAKAKAAAAKAGAGDRKKAKKPVVDEKPSPNQPILDKYLKVIEENLGSDKLEDSYINRLSKDVPTLVAKPESYYQLAEFLRFNEQLAFDYLSEIHGSDFETHMEVYLHLFSFQHKHSVALKVKIENRDHPEIPSVTPIWLGANWPEREAYDLLGIIFTGHPKLERILMPDDWVGHPLRKDYEPYDVEV